MKTAFGKLALVCVLVATAAACGGKGSDLSIAGPSPTTGGGSSTTGATISGRVNRGSGLAQTDTMATSSLTVTVAGTSITATVDGTGSFTLNGVPTGNVVLQFSGPNVNATVTITVGAQEQIQITVTVNGSSAQVESQSHAGANNRAEIKGSITAIDAAARTIRVSGALVTVPADATIRRGSLAMQFSDLLVGDRVEVRGTVVGEGVRATEVKVEGERFGQLLERKGVVSNLQGTCPSLTFNIGSTRVTTNGSTFFKDGACATVLNGVEVEVKGQPQTDGSIVASMVEQEDGEDDDRNEVRAQGLVSALGTTACPNISFMIGTTRVTTDASTDFEGLTCADVQNGTQVEVKGTLQADGSLLAREVEREDEDDDDNEVRVTGTVSELGATACPAITFTVAGTAVTTSSATRFDDISCANVQNGVRVEVRGTHQSSGGILATRVKRD